jgi:hypothetical protein
MVEARTSTYFVKGNWSGRRRVPVGIHPPPVVPGSGCPGGSSRLPGRGCLGLDLGQRLHDNAALVPVLTVVARGGVNWRFDGLGYTASELGAY